MYGEFKEGQAIPRREPYGAELVVGCPTCGRKKGIACVIRGNPMNRPRDDDETTGHPHNKRYIAAGMEWAPPDVTRAAT